MTAEEWETSGSASRMLRYVAHTVNDREWRLIFVGCARQIWDGIPRGPLRDAVEAGERFADGEASENELASRQRDADAFLSQTPSYSQTPERFEMDPLQLHRILSILAVRSPSDIHDARSKPTWHYMISLIAGPLVRPVLREVLGNPFRPSRFAPEWRTSTAVELARGMYDSRDFAAMPVLADALQDAGCDVADVLDHCRGSGPHVRGCWVADHVLGKR